jgi:TPR repeat protein
MLPQTVSSRFRHLALVALLSSAAPSCASHPTAQHVGWSQSELGLEGECQQGKIAACGELGSSLLQRSQPSTHERERALVLLELACGQDDRPSCTKLGMYYLNRDEGKDAQARARDLLARMCEQDQAEACRGRALGHRQEDPLDKRVARGFLDKACRLGDAQACEEIAVAELRDDSSGNRAQATQALGLACAQGRRSSCYRLAQLMLTDPDKHQDGLRQMIANCEQGHDTSCVVAAFASAPLFVDRPSCADAVKYAQRACVAKDEDGCAIVEACRPTPPGDTGRAQRLEWACERQSAVACLYWADLQQHGPLRKAEPARIRAAYALACRGLGTVSPVACVRSAIAALGVAKEPAEKDEVATYLRQTCERHSSGEACCFLGQAYLKGETVPQDKERAKDLRNRGCDLGRKECCSPIK